MKIKIGVDTLKPTIISTCQDVELERIYNGIGIQTD